MHQHLMLTIKSVNFFDDIERSMTNSDPKHRIVTRDSMQKLKIETKEEDFKTMGAEDTS